MNELESNSSYLVFLRRTLIKHFDSEELRTLCFDLGIDYEDLPSNTRSGKARELIAFLNRQDRINQFLEAATQSHPFVDWEFEPKLSSRSSNPSLIIPPPILEYLNQYPTYYVIEDIKNYFVRTSPESFFFAVQKIFESLASGEKVWSTDNVSVTPNFVKYWIYEGLEYLKLNHKVTVQDNVEVNRIFIVTKEELNKYQDILSQISLLHAKAGVIIHIAFYENLPPHCRYDFALWGDKYVDEVVYDFKGTQIVDNYIHWSESKINQFTHKMSLIQNLIEPEWIVSEKREDEFRPIIEFAANLREEFHKLKFYR